MQNFDLVIRGGTLVTASEIYQADIGIQGGIIAAIGTDLQGKQVIDAKGKLVLPGAIDPHVHLDMPQGAAVSSDDFETGTIAAAFGGTTTLIDFIEPEIDEPLLDALRLRRAQADGKVSIDYGLHMTLSQANAQVLNQVPAALEAGCSSFKTYLTYEGFRLDDESFLAACEAVGKAGGIVLVHAENHAAIERLRAQALSAGNVAPRFHPRTRPEGTEGEAVERALTLAEIADCPLYVVHVSTGRGAEAMARARLRGQHAFGETCPQYLVLTHAEFDRPGFDGAKFVCSPPLRPADNPPVLWHQLAADGLSSVGTDHCPFNFEGQKDLGRADFTKIPNGLPGIESRLALLYTFGVGQKRLSLNRWVDVCSTTPAKIFGLYPRKGTLAPGADADIVLFDPQRKVTLSRSVLHERVDYTPYDGISLKGYPTTTIARGKILCREGEWIGPTGQGQFLKRGRHERHTYFA